MNHSNNTLPVIPLRGSSVFPNMVIHFEVIRDKSINAIEEAMKNNSKIFLVSQKDFEKAEVNDGDLYSIGVICEIKQVIKLPKGTTRILLKGLDKANILNIDYDTKEFIEATLEVIEEKEVEDSKAFKNSLIKSFEEYIKESDGNNKKLLEELKKEKSLSKLVYNISAYIQIDAEDKQLILETLDLQESAEKLLVYLEEEIEVLKLENDLHKKAKERASKLNKDYFLREQIKVIQSELGEDGDSELDEYISKVDKLKLPKDVKEKVDQEIKKLKNTHQSEAANIRSYLDWIIALPWNKSTKDVFDINKAKEVLDKEHYGLEKVKERVIEYLAVKKYTKSLSGPIICLVGPPGVGKSSIAKSIAESVNRKFVRISLGGVKDESEIRGHRRTYVGAIPGRIIYSLKEAKSNNPVMLLDEIDKLNKDYKGSPADALLEVLDSKQNDKFRDSYMEVDIDLSNVLFITTANSLDTIPRPLLDRMEIIEVSGYTYEEKFNITKNHLLPKSLKEHKVTDNTIKISDNAIKEIIDNYTRESGVRSLERQVSKIIRKSITEIIKYDKKSINVSNARLEKYLGPKKFEFKNEDEPEKVGVVTGLAWTAYGGDTLPVEVVIMDGSGKLQLTGKLGEVMQESAKTAYSYVRANAKKYGINIDFHKKKDIHIHVPEGAVPKDGPSAGVTMVTALVSALAKKKVINNLAMTGEVTLTGKVLAIGGVKEKCLAANRIGVKTIILPKENEKNIKDIPNSIKNKLNLIFADKVEQVLENALIGVDTNDN